MRQGGIGVRHGGNCLFLLNNERNIWLFGFFIRFDETKFYFMSIPNLNIRCRIGELPVLGGFLITYRGNSHYKYENLVSNLAGLFAFGVALFPTSFTDFKEKNAACQFIYLLPNNKLPSYVNSLHYVFAALLFICFIIFCMRIFQDADEGKMDVKKKRRNKIYKGCGIAILISILCIAACTIYERITGTTLFAYSTLLFETTSLLPFGFSWLLKGSLNWKNSKSNMVRKMIKVVR